MNVSIIYAFGRSGSTLLNRCLGCIPGNIVLSEVNPCGDVVPIEIQASEWFNLIEVWEIETFSQKSYQEKIEILAERARQRGERLIIRDWTTINFLWNTSNKFHVPSYQLEQGIYLASTHLESRAIVFSRKAVDVYSSFIKTFEHLSHFTPQEFSRQYLRYSAETCGFPVFHYEDFCKNPHEVLEFICRELDVNYCSSFGEKFYQYDLCTGDNLLQNPSRGSQLKDIKPLQDSENSQRNTYLTSDFAKADYLFGYGGDSNYIDTLELSESYSYQQKLLSILSARDAERARLRTNIYGDIHAAPHLTESSETEFQVEKETELLGEDDHSIVINSPEEKKSLVDELQELEEKYQQLQAEYSVIKHELLVSSSIKGALVKFVKSCLRIGSRQP